MGRSPSRHRAAKRRLVGLLFAPFLPVFFAVFSPAFGEPPATLRIVDRPIRFDEERKRLTLAYRRAHLLETDPVLTIDPKVIVLHHTASRTLEEAWQTFNHTTMTADRPALLQASALNVSAHFLVDRNGVIFRLMPETWMARHCIGLNQVAIGIENVGGLPEVPLTALQIESNALLVRDLKRQYPAITHLLGHHETGAFRSHHYFREADPKYFSQKIDPGPKFMRQVRRRLQDLRLEGPEAQNSP